MSDETTPTPAPAPSATSNSGGAPTPERTFRDKDSALGAAGIPGEPKFKGRKRRKVSYLTINKIEYVDYKDVAILRRFINDRGKILPARQTGNTAKQQRMISRAVHRAREMALLPFVVKEMAAAERFARPRAPRQHEPVEAPQQAPAPAPAQAPAAEAATEATTE
ncbi:MAG: 30S ribosomal protein S18 [Fimbriimonadaceae bacterium]|nr:30S ribosomal protein S18 [Fimbriimonadaceae bacterium]